MVSVFTVIVCDICMYLSSCLRQLNSLLNSLAYLAVHKPKFAWVHDELLCDQKSQCSGKGFLVSLPWGSCHPWSKTSLCRSCQYEQQSSGPMEWFWLYYWFHKVIAAVSGTPQGIQNLLSRIFYHFQEEFFNNCLFFYKRGGQSICRNIMNKIIQINERKQHQEWPSDHLILSRGFKSASKS